MAPVLDLCRVERVEKLPPDPGSAGVAAAAEGVAGVAGSVTVDRHPAPIEFVPVA
ncbi:MAG TPA: hypothetical protein VGC45_08115 [Gryllotalpicola sp.]